MVRLVSWNINRRVAAWSALEDLDADVGLLQEAVPPPTPGVEVFPDPAAPWITEGPPRKWRTAVARLSDRVHLVERPTVGVSATSGDWTVSRNGTITAADVLVGNTAIFTAISVYSPWDSTPAGGLYADASAHRLLSDLSALMYSRNHRLLVAGDWNILYGYGEHGNAFFAARYQTVFDRAEALGLVFLGPQHPHGRQADPWPEELPPESRCVPTFHHNQQNPATATRQLDFVFASRSIADSVSTSAMNDVNGWGPSDHCRIKIDVDLEQLPC